MTRFPIKVLDAILPTDPALRAAYAPKGRVAYVDGFPGADPTGVTDSTAAFQAALASLPRVTARGTVTVVGKPGSAGSGTAVDYPVGTIQLGAGVYQLGAAADVGNLGPFVSVLGPGHNATTLDYRGAGVCLQAYNAVRPANDTFFNLTGMGGRFDGFTIAGENAGVGATGLTVGDTEGFILGPDLFIRNFTTAGATGLKFQNNYWWTENVVGWATVLNCTNGVVFDAGQGSTTQNGYVGGDNSFMYCDLSLKVYCFEQQNGFVLQNGATYQGGRLVMRANMKMNTAATSNALLVITGTCPAGHLGAGTPSQLWNSEVQIRAEVNGSGANKPQTIRFGTVGSNAVWACTGQLSFSGGATSWTPSNYTVAGTSANGSFQFTGPIGGDANLAVVGQLTTRSTVYPVTQMFSSGSVAAQTGDFSSYTLGQNLTVGFGSQNAAGAQRRTFIIKQAASGGPYTVTWPKNASPTAAAPTVLWAGGTAPVMTATAGAVDVYQLETIDGATWFGRAIQAAA